MWKENLSGTEYDYQSHIVKGYGISESKRGSTKYFTGFLLSQYLKFGKRIHLAQNMIIKAIL